MTAEEYGRSLQAIHASTEASPGAEDSALDQEFLLLIDYRLGWDFPNDRRLLLLDAQRAARKRMKTLTGRLFIATFAPGSYARRVAELQRRLLVVFRTILNPEEFVVFTGMKAPGDASGIIDPALIPRL